VVRKGLMLSKVEWWARHERMAEDGGHSWRSFTVMAVPGLGPGIGPGHPDPVKRCAFPTGITGTRPVMTRESRLPACSTDGFGSVGNDTQRLAA
jgi:hypothetical protein